VAEWKDDKGYGFVAPSLGGERVFLHISGFSRRARRPLENELVTYEVTLDERGRPRASNVRFSSEPVAASGSSNRSPFPVAMGSIFLAIVVGVVLAKRMPGAILVLYLGASLLTFMAYWLDKSAAQSGRWRTPENTLHLLSLIGGWPGATAAQKLLRHKSSKVDFQRVFWVTVALNVAAFVWFFTEDGSAFLGETWNAWGRITG
jgi:uncharacterized membrane protein YsdA (DUF1294 family)/cold shock CspA family protein